MKTDEYWKMMENRPAFYRQKIRSLIGFESAGAMDEVRKLIRDKVGAQSSILELGSGNNNLQNQLRRAGHQGLYHTMDIETKYPHDFHSLEEIRDTYDYVLMLELIEHMTLETFFHYLDFAEGRLQPAGHLVISTPNAAHVNAVWRGDMTHVRPYPLRDLFALLTSRGYATELYRVHLIEEHYGVLRWVRRRLAQLLAWILYADIEEGVLILAHRQGS